MPTSTTPQRRMLERSLTWPPPILTPVEGSHKSQPASMSAGATTSDNATKHDSFFEDDLDQNPENHFLSPVTMYEYDDWADDSDSDDDEVEWNAGITDFALFDDDRRKARESNAPLPGKWNDMLAQQASALQRAVKRNQADSRPDPVNRRLLLPAPEADLPSLTPDTSPDLRDDLDVESYHGQSASRPRIPNYLTVTITPPGDASDEDAAIESDEDLPLSFAVARRYSQNRKLQRPGLSHSRTMSGKVHSWRRPDSDIFMVREDPEAEARAELWSERSGDEMRGST